MSVLTCAFCLSSDRNIFFIDERLFHLVYSLFDVDDGQYLKYLHTEGRLRICWVCQARLSSCARFAARAQRSVRVLRGYLDAAHELPPRLRSGLCVTEVELVDIAPSLDAQSDVPVLRTADEALGGRVVVCDLEEQMKSDIKVETNSSDDDYSDADVEQVKDAELVKKEQIELKVKAVKKEVLSKKAGIKRKTGRSHTAAVSTAKKTKLVTKKRKGINVNKATVTPKPTRQKRAAWSVRWVTNERARERYEEERARETAGNFVCEQCQRSTFASEAELAEHVAAKHDESAGAFQCDLCHYRFETKPTLERHIEAHCRLYSCAHCPWDGWDVGEMRGHAETHGDVKGTRGDAKGMRGDSKGSRGDAKGTLGDVKGTSARVCQRCKESFTSCAQLRAHKAHCCTYKCSDCGKVFRDKSAYFKHTPVHKDANSKDKLYCQVCDRQFTSPQWFKTHFRTSLKHVSRDSFQHECPHCQLRFHIAQRLKEHIAVKHLNRGLYGCDLCPKSYTVAVSLRKHRARVHNIGAVRAPTRDKVCDHCGKAFTSNHLLNNHVRLHTGEKPFKCTLCPAAFAQNGTLYMHTLSVHRKKLSKDGAGDSTEDAPYQCEECGKGFWSSSQQRAHHKLSHLKQSNFTCDVCSKIFASSSHLKDHLAGRHGVLYSDSFKCDACGKRFNTPSALRVHAKTHVAGGSVHACRACAACFRNPGQLYMHFKLKHLKLKRSDKVSLKNISNPERELIVNGKPQ